MASPVTPADLKALLPSSTGTLCNNFVKALLQFPSKVYQIIAWLLDTDGNLSTDFLKAVIPTGDLKMSAVSTPATGWLLCDGSAVSRATYADLFAAIATTFGSGDGSTTFNLPDYRARFPVGVGTFTGGSNVAVGGTGGEDEHVLIETEMPKHRHGFRGRGDAAGDDHTITGWTYAGGSPKGFAPDYHGTTINFNPPAETDPATPVTPFDTDTNDAGWPMFSKGDDDAHNNLPPYLGVFFFVKT